MFYLLGLLHVLKNGKVCIIENISEGIASSELTVLRPSNNVLPRYLFYFVHMHRIKQFAVSQMMGTTGRQRVPDYVFKKDLHFEFPVIPEQQKIVAILSKVDELIQKIDQIIMQTQRLKKGLMQRLFTKGIEHNKFRPVKSLFGKFEEIPEDWICTKLNKIAKFRQGLQIEKVKRYKQGGKNRIKLIKITDFYSDRQSDEYIDILSSSKQSVICDKDDILVARTGNTLGLVLTDVAGVFHNNTFALDRNREMLDKMFFYYLLTSPRVQSYMKIISTRTGQPDLTHNEF